MAKRCKSLIEVQSGAKCTCGGSPVIILACSGASNVGQLANEVARRLSNGDSYKMSCLAGIGAHVPTIVETAKAARKVVVIDGCPVACGKKAADLSGVKIQDHFIITELGIKKSYDLDIDADTVSHITDRIRSSL
ncbi:MAG TPA: putative zinc-binding protein [Methanomassiliicoccales archaeon]|nr:putative zinc-binding protein [Methanomassiliicoccales archaeon]